MLSCSSLFSELGLAETIIPTLEIKQMRPKIMKLWQQLARWSPAPSPLLGQRTKLHFPGSYKEVGPHDYFSHQMNVREGMCHLRARTIKRG